MSTKNVKNSDIFTIFTDGACDNRKAPHYGGYGFVILEDGELIHEGSRGEKNTTSNRMELTAIISSLAELPDNSKITIFTDSNYCIIVLDHNKKEYEKNFDLIQEFRNIVKEKNISYKFTWVAGHSGNKWNDYVDNLANQAYLKVGGSKKHLEKIHGSNNKSKNKSINHNYSLLFKGDKKLREMIDLWVENRTEHYELLCDNLKELKSKMKKAI